MWRTNMLSAGNLSEDSFNQQKNLLNSMLSYYLDELDPKRRLEREKAMHKHQDKFSSLKDVLKSSGFKTKK